MSEAPAVAASRAPNTGRMLQPEQLDELGRAVLLLTRELWVAIDRQRVLEAVLEARGIPVKDAVRDHQPDAALTAELAAERQRITEALLATLCPPEEGA